MGKIVFQNREKWKGIDFPENTDFLGIFFPHFWNWESPFLLPKVRFSIFYVSPSNPNVPQKYKFNVPPPRSPHPLFRLKTSPHFLPLLPFILLPSPPENQPENQKDSPSISLTSTYKMTGRRRLLPPLPAFRQIHKNIENIWDFGSFPHDFIRFFIHE